LVLKGFFGVVLYGRLPAGHSHSSHLDAKFGGIGIVKKMQNLPTVSNLVSFLEKDYGKFELQMKKLWEEGCLNYRDYVSWLNPYGAALEYHGEQLDFKIYFKEGSGAVMRYRAFCGGNLEWSSDEITLLSQVPPGAPNVIPRKELFVKKTKNSFEEMIYRQLSKVASEEWKIFFQKLETISENELQSPFVLRCGKSPQLTKNILPPEPEPNEQSERIYSDPELFVKSRKVKFSYSGKIMGRACFDFFY
jgi:hypothetical protein